MVSGNQFSATEDGMLFAQLVNEQKKEQNMDTLDKPLIQPDQFINHPFIPFLQGRPVREDNQ